MLVSKKCKDVRQNFDCEWMCGIQPITQTEHLRSQVYEMNSLTPNIQTARYNRLRVHQKYKISYSI